MIVPVFGFQVLPFLLQYARVSKYTNMPLHWALKSVDIAHIGLFESLG